jgi:hypothetical protein
MDAAFDAHREAAGEYVRALADRNARLEEREAELRQDLFGAPSSKTGQAFTSALLQAEGADDERLASLASLAAKTGDKTLGRAVFAVAHERGIADIALPYLNADAEALEAYRELASMPTPAERERAEKSGLAVPTLDAIKPSPETAADAHRLEALERVQRSQRG